MMRSFYKIICGAAVAFLALGLLLGAMGFLLGGRPGGLYEYSQGVDLPLVGSGRFGILRWGNPLYGRDTVEMNYTYTGEKAQIRRLDFDLSCANVTIREGEAFWVRAEKINAKRFRTEVNGDTWEIECDVKNVGRMGGDRAPNITITIPKGFVAEELELDNAMGTMEVRDLAAQQSSILVGMGDLVVKNFSSGDCALEIGMGSLELSGSITGRGSINCGMGSAILALKGEPTDYGYTATVGMGSVTIAGKELDTDSNSTPGPWEIAEIGGLGGSRSWNTEAPNFFYIDCGMGSVDIQFVK